MSSIYTLMAQVKLRYQCTFSDEDKYIVNMFMHVYMFIDV